MGRGGCVAAGGLPACQAGAMFLGETYSAVGRSTGSQLDNLRRQLGVGTDPAYDYSAMTEIQRKLTQKKDKKAKEEPSGNSALEELRRALQEAAGQGEDGGREQEEAAKSSPGNTGRLPQSDKQAKAWETWAFRTTSRDDCYKNDAANKFRAPPVGSYRPKAEVCEPRSKVTDFGVKSPTRSRAIGELDREVARLKAEKQPWEHLAKTSVSVELLEEAPAKPKPRQPVLEFSKQSARPDLVKAAGIVYHDNSFTAGVLDGDLACSNAQRCPQWDFAKMSTVEDKPRETFFQPGQYKVEPGLGLTKPSPEMKNVPFEKQTSRRPLRETVGLLEVKSRPGDHLPDRSLSRSCPLLQPKVQGWDFNKYTERPPINEVVKPYHRAEDPEIDRAVLRYDLTHDRMEAVKVTWSKARTVERFEGSLKREDQFKIHRRYGEDIALQLRKENLTRGPVSVELLPEVGRSQQLRPRVLTSDFGRMASREGDRRYTEAPSRNRDMREAMRFERESRPGEAKLQAEALSPSATAIVKRRAARTYDAMVDMA